MQKTLILILFLLFTLNLYSIPKPKDNNVGALIGKVYVEMDKDMEAYGGTLAQGRYYYGEVFLENKDNGKKYSSLTNIKGLFYFLNLEPGNYSLKKFTISQTSGSRIFTLNQTMGVTGINFTIESKKISIVKTVKILKEVLPTPAGQSGETRYSSSRDTIFREENNEEVKAYFVKLDNLKQWREFDFQDDSIKLDEDFKVAENYRELNEYGKAIEFYNKSINADNKNYLAYYNRGICYYNQKGYVGALEDFNKVVEINDKYLDVYGYRGFTYYYLKDYDNAIKDLLKNLEIYPDNANTLRFLGNAYENKGDLVKAKQYLSKSLKKDNISKESFNDLGLKYKATKEYNKAIESFNKSIDLDKNYSLAYYNLGNTYFDIKDFARAKENYDKAIEINPKYAKAIGMLGRIYEKMNNYDKGIELLSKAIEFDKKNPEGYYYRGCIYAKYQKFTDALNDFNKAIENDEKYAGAYSGKGYYVLFHQNNIKEAVANLNKAIELNPKNGWTYNTRGIVLYSQGNINDAFKDIEKAETLYEKLSYANFFHILTSYKISKEALGKANSLLMQKINHFDDPWIKAIGDMFAGKIKTNDLLFLKFESLNKNENEKLCEAYFYMGVKNLIEDKKHEAIENFKKCIGTNVFYYAESIIAKKELEILTKQ